MPLLGEFLGGESQPRVSALPRKSSWGRQKPPLGASINWAHPLARGLMFCAVLNGGRGAQVDLVTHQLSDTAGIVGSGRLRYDSVATNGTAITWPNWKGRLAGNQAMASATGITVVTTAYLDSTSYGTSSVFALHTSSFHMGAITTNNNGGYSVAFHETVHATTDLQSSRINQPAYADWMIAATYDPNVGSAMYINGKLDATSAGHADTLTDTQFLQYPRVGGLVGGIGFAYYYFRRLSQAEIQWLNAEPYAFLEPPAPKISYFEAPAPPPGNLVTGGSLKLHAS